ncbi:transposable element Tcb2 transposase [Trichonephila clavipes]|nr:transposable element Tcb2 transposase [Trichonephila clavipes]
MSEGPILHLYKYGRKTELHTDACKQGYGAILLQEAEDGKLHSVYYMSKKTNTAEENISEDYAKKELITRIARWALQLEEFDYEIEHRARSRMKHVDALSRYPVMMICNDTLTSKLKNAQEEDDNIQTLKSLLEKQESEEFFERNGILYKYLNGREFMARRNHLDDFTRRRMIGKLEEERTVTSVAAEFGINKSVVSRTWKEFQTTVTAVRKVGGDRPRTTTAGDDRYIILQVNRGRRQSASVIAQQLSTAKGRQVSRFTVARHLHKGGLFARRLERCLPLKVDHRRHSLQWCREHKNWTTVNRVVSSLRMRVGSVPEAILNAF